MRKVILAALLAGTGFATPAVAQEYSPFNGFRVEGLVGYDALRSGERVPNGTDQTVEGVGYGVGVGYDFDLGGLVAGVEAELSGSSAEQEANETLNGINFTSRLEPGRDIYVGGRLGVRATPTTLVYAKGGYTNTRLRGGFNSVNDSYDFAANADGWRIGGGVEQAFASNAFGKIEYRYSNYNNLDFRNGFDFENFRSEDFGTSIDLDRHQVMAGFGFRF